MEKLTGPGLESSGTREPISPSRLVLREEPWACRTGATLTPSGNRESDWDERKNRLRSPPQAEVAHCRVRRAAFASGPQFPHLGHGLDECSRAHPGDGVLPGLSWRTRALSPLGVLLGRLSSGGNKIPAVS